MRNNIKSLVKGGICLLLYGYVSHATVNFNKLKVQAIDSIKARAANVIELNDQDVLDTMERQGFFNRLNTAVVRLRDLQTKAIEYEAAGNTIQANLSKAQAAITENSMEGLIYDIEANLSLKLYDTEDKKKETQAKKYEEQVIKHREEIERSSMEARVFLYEAKSAQYAADGQQDLAEKYKAAAAKMTEAEKFQSEANRYRNTENKIQADVYTAKASLAKVEAVSHIENQTTATILRTQVLFELYHAESTRYAAAGQELIAKKYTEAAELILKVLFSNSPEESKIIAAEAMAKTAADMATRCADHFK